MQTERLGIITLFGILVPGAYLVGIVVLVVAGVLEMAGRGGHAAILTFMNENIAVSATLFLFVGYLFGVVVRLFAPERVDALDAWYLVHIRRRRSEWVTEVFPYGKSLASHFQKAGMQGVPALMGRLNKLAGEPGNTTFFNYCKCFVHANDTSLGRQIEEAEALVRFLSGTTLVLLAGLAACIPLSFLFLIHGTQVLSALYGALALLSILTLCLILERFKYQRRREVVLVWSAVYLVLGGGAQCGIAGNRDALIDSAFFPGTESGSPADPMA